MLKDTAQKFSTSLSLRFLIESQFTLITKFFQGFFSFSCHLTKGELIEIISHSVEWLVCLVPTRVFWNTNPPLMFTGANSQQMESHFCGHILEVGACLHNCTYFGINYGFGLIVMKVIDEFMEVEVEWMHHLSLVEWYITFVHLPKKGLISEMHTWVGSDLLLTICFLAIF